MAVANAAGFDAILTIDKQLEHQQNLSTLPLPVIVLDGDSNALPALLPFVPFLRTLFQAPLERALYIVEDSGTVLRLNEPRHT
jgi:hypothetical protein